MWRTKGGAGLSLEKIKEKSGKRVGTWRSLREGVRLRGVLGDDYLSTDRHPQCTREGKGDNSD